MGSAAFGAAVGMGIDALVVSSHKWMLGPLGVGFMAFSERGFVRIQPTIMGWLSVNEPFAFRRELDFLPDGGRFEPGTENAAGRFGLVARLEQIHETGADVIEARSFASTDPAPREAPIEAPPPQPPAIQTPIQTPIQTG